MNIAIVAGILLGWATIAADQHLHKLPDGLTILLYAVAFAMIIAGLVLRKKMKGKHDLDHFD